MKKHYYEVTIYEPREPYPKRVGESKRFRFRISALLNARKQFKRSPTSIVEVSMVVIWRPGIYSYSQIKCYGDTEG